MVSSIAASAAGSHGGAVHSVPWISASTTAGQALICVLYGNTVYPLTFVMEIANPLSASSAYSADAPEPPEKYCKTKQNDVTDEKCENLPLRTKMAKNALFLTRGAVSKSILLRRFLEN